MLDDASGQLTIAATPTRMPAWRQAALSLYWFATSAHWAILLIFLLPIQALAIGGDADKGKTLGLILCVGAAVSMLVAPLFGAWSDRLRTPWGRRRPFLVVGTLANIAGLLTMMAIPAVKNTLVPYILVFGWLQVANNFATAPYSALIPDVVPKDQRGSASGWMGLMTMLGNLVGGLLGWKMTELGRGMSGLLGLPMDEMAGVRALLIIVSGIMLLGMLGTVASITEPPAPPVAPFRWGAFLHGLAQPLKAPDFRWVFFTRLLVMLGVFTVQENLQYFLRDVIARGKELFDYAVLGHVIGREAHQAAAVLIIALLIGAVVSAYLAGVLSDRFGRKRIVYLSGGLQGVMALTFLVLGRFDLVVMVSLIYGLGYGAYQAVDWALATDVLPSEEDYAKDMGVWHIAVTLPQVTAAPIAGLLLDIFQGVGRSQHIANLGYIVILCLAFVYFISGTLAVRNVRGAR